MTQPATRLVPVETSPPYSLHVGPGAARDLPGWLVTRSPAARYALVTDSNVAALHAASLLDALNVAGLSTTLFEFPAGENQKTRATKERVEDAIARSGMGRDSAVIALGGGVVGDLAGFIAATYHRGIPYVLVPTTLLAMVDASVGGKTGVDTPMGKNLIGAFHQPAAVFIDTEYLVTLPERHYRSGLAEVVKAGAILDAELFELLRSEAPRLLARDPALVPDVIERACRIKASVVSADEKEGDLRKILNFGHTIGHALEIVTGYSMTHGEAVAVGMVVEARMAVRERILEASAAAAIEALLSALELPTRLPVGHLGATPAAILEAARADKKARKGRIEYALPAALGRMARGAGGYGIPVDDGLALSVLQEMS